MPSDMGNPSDNDIFRELSPKILPLLWLIDD